MDKIKKENNKKRDILEYLQCMVNTETPTPIDVVNKMLDLIPVEVYNNDNSTFLCPCCKDGIFLREIAIRILKHKYNKLGEKEFLKNQNSILQHILEKQLFGIAISYRGYEVTKRTLYTNNLINLYNVNNIEKQKEITEIKTEKKTEVKNENNIKKIDNKIQNTTKDKYSVFSEFFKHHFTDYINKAREEREKERKKQEQIEKEKYIRKIIVKRNTDNIFFSIERHNNNEEAFLAKRQNDERIKPGSVPKIEKEGKINIKQSKEDIIKDLNEEIDFYLYGYKKTIKETENITTNNTNSNTYYNWYENNYKEIEEHSKNIDRVKKCCYDFSEARWFVNAIHNSYFKHKINIKDKKQEYININNIYFNEALGKLVQDKDGNETEIQALHFIKNLEEISQFFESKGVKDMQFDVVIGNPPYQHNYGTPGKNAAKSFPIFHDFIEEAIKLKPKYFSFIVPDKWAFGTKELNKFKNDFLNDYRISKFYDIIDGASIFPTVNTGGICYFLWDKNKKNKEVNIYTYKDVDNLKEHTYRQMNNGSNCFSRFEKGDIIIKKCASKNTMTDIVTPRAVFGVSGSLTKDVDKEENKYFYIGKDIENKVIDKQNTIPILSLNNHKDDPISFIDKQNTLIPNNEKNRFRWYYVDKNAPFLKLNNLNKWKFVFPKSGAESIYRRTLILKPNEIFTDTWLNVFVDTEQQARNVESYFKTYLFRYLLICKTSTQNVYADAYLLVPNLSNIKNPRTNKIGWESDWSNEDLQKLFNFTDDEMEYIKEQAIQADNGKGGDEVDNSKNEIEEEDE